MHALDESEDHGDLFDALEVELFEGNVRWEISTFPGTDLCRLEFWVGSDLFVSEVVRSKEEATELARGRAVELAQMVEEKLDKPVDSELVKVTYVDRDGPEQSRDTYTIFEPRFDGDAWRVLVDGTETEEGFEGTFVGSFATEGLAKARIQAMFDQEDAEMSERLGYPVKSTLVKNGDTKTLDTGTLLILRDEDEDDDEDE